MPLLFIQAQYVDHTICYTSLRAFGWVKRSTEKHIKSRKIISRRKKKKIDLGKQLSLSTAVINVIYHLGEDKGVNYIVAAIVTYIL